MSKERIHLETVGRSAKLALGPVAPEPAPKLLKQVKKDMQASSKLIPDVAKTNTFTINKMMNNDRKLITRLTDKSSTDCPETFTVNIPVG